MTLSATIKKYSSKPDWWWVSVVLLIALMMAVFVHWYIGNEHWVYVWDETNWWYKVINLQGWVRSGSWHDFFQVVWSSLGEDYSYLPPLLYSWLYPLITVKSREYFILIIAWGYLLPTVLSYWYLGRVILQKVIAKSHQQSMATGLLIGLIAITLLPHVWAGVMIGYMDVGGMALIAAVLCLYFQRSIPKQSLKHGVITSFLLVALYLYRRWYLSWSLGFLIWVVVNDVVLPLLKTKTLDTKLIRPLMVLLSGVIVFSALFASSYFKHLTTINYSDQLSAFLISTNPTEYLLELLRLYGGFLVVMVVGMSLWLWFTIPAIKKIILFAWWQVVFTTIVLMRIQNFHYPQSYLHLSSFCLIIVLFFGSFFATHKKYTVKRIFITVGLMACIAASFKVYFLRVIQRPIYDENVTPSSSPILRALTPLFFSSYRMLPRSRVDIPQILYITQYLDQHVGPDQHVYVLGSSDAFNFGLFQNACLSLGCNYDSVSDKILWTHDVDKRDGFPDDFIDADYVLVAEPLQVVLRPEDQQLIVGIGSQFLAGQGFGRHFTKADDFSVTLQEGLSVSLYKKTSELSPESIHEVETLLQQSYPDYPFVYQAHWH